MKLGFTGPNGRPIMNCKKIEKKKIEITKLQITNLELRSRHQWGKKFLLLKNDEGRSLPFATITIQTSLAKKFLFRYNSSFLVPFSNPSLQEWEIFSFSIFQFCNFHAPSVNNKISCLLPFIFSALKKLLLLILDVRKWSQT